MLPMASLDRLFHLDPEGYITYSVSAAVVVSAGSHSKIRSEMLSRTLIKLKITSIRQFVLTLCILTQTK